MSDLLKRIADSADPSAFRSLFEQFAPRVKAYMMRQGADPTTAEELAQETLMTVWRKARLYSPEKGSATTWIFTIARNLRIDRIRKEAPWQPLPEGHDEEQAHDTPPDEAVSERERQARVRAALDLLPRDQLDVVTLSFVDGLSHSEIAAETGLPLGTIKSRIRLALDKLRHQMG